jgi:hypothetical protein
MARLEVDLGALHQTPELYLLQLGDCLSQQHPFPQVYYFNNGIPSNAVDVGGLRRDFITRLFERLFSGETGSLLSINGDAGLLPRKPVFGQENSYRIIGNIFALCYLGSNNFTTGALFDPLLFEILKIPGIAEKEVPAMLQAALILKGLPIDLVKWLNGTRELSSFSPEVQANIAARLETAEIPDKQIPFKDLLLEDGVVYAATNIAFGMKASLGESAWHQLQTEETMQLKAKIEGELTPQKLKDKLVFDIGAASQEEAERTRGFLINWIDRADLVSLERFVRAISGNKTLSNQPLQIQFYNRGEEYIPVARTCFFSLELSCEYLYQETFDAKLHLLLTEGLADGGFQIA